MTAIVNWVGGSIGCLFSYFFSNATPQDKALEAIAKVTNLSKKVISQDRCFEAVQEAFKRKDWNLLDNIAEVLDDLTSSDGTTLFQALICDKSFKYTDKLKQCKSVSNFLKQAELWRIEAKPETKPAFSDHPPENLVFQGGGATGIAHVGALRKLEEKNLISNVKRTAGTSAGSILAALLAVGYTSLELEQELSKDFFEFFDHTSLIGSACLDASFSGPSVNKIFFKLLTLIKKHGIKAAMNPKKFWKELADFKGCCKGDKLRDWFEELIFRKTGIKHCTFGELALLTRKKSSQFKHLHVFVTKVEGELKTVRISSEDQNFKKVIISDAILASACIPGVFEPHVLHEKSHEYGVRIPAKHHGTFLDGGVSYNFPLEAFDKKEFCLTDELDGQEKEEYYFNPKTMGFSLHSPLSTDINFTNITNVRDLINMLYLVGFTIYSAENSLRETILSKNKLRTVSISNEGISMLAFGLTTNEKRRLVQSGSKALESFLSESCHKPTVVHSVVQVKEKRPEQVENRSPSRFSLVIDKIFNFTQSLFQMFVFKRSEPVSMSSFVKEPMKLSEKKEIVLTSLKKHILENSSLFYNIKEIENSPIYWLMEEWINNILVNPSSYFPNAPRERFHFNWVTPEVSNLIYEPTKWWQHHKHRKIFNIEVPVDQVWKLFYQFLVSKNLVSKEVEVEYFTSYYERIYGDPTYPTCDQVEKKGGIHFNRKYAIVKGEIKLDNLYR